MPVETTHQFARVMRELGIQQIFALSPQAKGRVERMLETFQDRLVTELRLAGASTIDQAKEVLQEFLPKINARFALATEQPEMAYRPVPAELSLTETICIKDTRKLARDNTVKYHWRVLQLLPGQERPSYAGLRVDVMERADGDLMIRYQGEAVDYQEGPPPSSALWGAVSACSPGMGATSSPSLRRRLVALPAFASSPVGVVARVAEPAGFREGSFLFRGPFVLVFKFHVSPVPFFLASFQQEGSEVHLLLGEQIQ